MSIYAVFKNIKKVRKEKFKETQEEFSERCGISVETLSNLERGAVSPQFETVFKIAFATGVSLDLLVKP